MPDEEAEAPWGWVNCSNPRLVCVELRHWSWCFQLQNLSSARAPRLRTSKFLDDILYVEPGGALCPEQVSPAFQEEGGSRPAASPVQPVSVSQSQNLLRRLPCSS